MPPETVSTEKRESSNFDHFLNRSLHNSLQREERERESTIITRTKVRFNFILHVLFDFRNSKKNLLHLAQNKTLRVSNFRRFPTVSQTENGRRKSRAAKTTIVDCSLGNSNQSHRNAYEIRREREARRTWCEASCQGARESDRWWETKTECSRQGWGFLELPALLPWRSRSPKLPSASDYSFSQFLRDFYSINSNAMLRGSS